MTSELKSYDQMVDDILYRIVQSGVGITDISRTSIIRTIVEAIVSEMDVQNYTIDGVYDMFDTRNLSGEELDARVSDIGIYRRDGTYAIDNIEFGRSTPAQNDIFIPSGTLINMKPDMDGNIIEFATTEDGKIAQGEMSTSIPIKCTNIGYIYIPAGELNIMPNPIMGVEYVINRQPIEGGTDIEDDNSLIERYYERLRTPATSGNIYHYLNWAKEVPGIGDAKVIPLWNGRGTVKVIVVDSNRKPASNELVDNIRSHIETVRPICARVTVTSAIAKSINIKADVRIADGYTLQDVQNRFASNIDKYRLDMAFRDEYISYAAIGNILFNTTGVIDYDKLLLNGIMQNIALSNNEVPIFDSVELGVI